MHFLGMSSFHAYNSVLEEDAFIPFSGFKLVSL